MGAAPAPAPGASALVERKDTFSEETTTTRLCWDRGRCLRLAESGEPGEAEGAMEVLGVRGDLEGESILLNDPGKMTPEGKSSAGLPQL